MPSSHLPASADPPAETPWRLIATHRVFRRLWIGQLLSNAGDWISFIALLALLLELTGSGMSVSLLLVCGTVPSFLLTPFAGVVADRCDRRHVLIAADLGRMLLTLGFLLIRRPEDAWMAYVLTAGIASASAFFGPAATAALPNIVSQRQLTAANGIAGATSGIMVALGAWLGGVISSQLGRPTAFMLDAASFLISAAVIASVRQSFQADTPADGAPSSLRHAVEELREAWRYALRHRTVLSVLLLKTAGGLGGGVLALLSVIPMQVLHAGDLGVGILYMARGLGSIVAALFAGGLVPDRPPARAAAAAAGIAMSGVFCAAFSASPTLAWAGLLVFVAYLGATLQWVYATALLQRLVEDRILGRISALDAAGPMLTATASTLLCGWGIVALGPRPVGLLAGAVLAVVGAAWLAWFTWIRPLRGGDAERPTA